MYIFTQTDVYCWLILDSMQKMIMQLITIMMWQCSWNYGDELSHGMAQVCSHIKVN